MKTLRYLWFTLAVYLLAACSNEDIRSSFPENGVIGNETALISISSKNLLPVDMNKTRAGKGIDQLLSVVNDLNIRVHLGDAAHVDFFCNQTEITSSSPVAGTIGNHTAKYIPKHLLDNINNTKEKEGGTQIHCDKIVASSISKIEIIANYGEVIASNVDYSSIKELDASNYLSKKYCMMYGVTTGPSSVENKHLENGTPCKLFQVNLKRTRAMISVMIVNNKLNKGVEITPRKIRLCNVPTSCTLQKLCPTPDKNKILQISDCVRVSQEREITEGLLKESIGSHAEANKELPKNFHPLYMYENMQGTNMQDTNTHPTGNHVTKYPAGITNVADAKNPNKNFKYSYVEIDADYRYREKSAVKVSGTITYRFFLGNNATDNFDIEGNHYYKLTLNLKGFGGAKEDGKVDENGNLVVNKEDLSWRVDMNTRDWGFEKSEYDFDSHYLDGKVQVVGENWKFTDVLKGNGYASWLTLNIEERDGQEWVNPTNIIKQNYKLKIVDGTLRFNVQPMFYQKPAQLDPVGSFDENSYRNSTNYREMQIEIQNTDTKEKDTIVIRQYAPIPVTVTVNGKEETFFMERFEEYDTDKDGNIAYGLPWGYEDNKLNKLKNFNYQNVKYNWGNPNKNKVGLNSTYLSEKGCAANVCYLKGQDGIQQGAPAEYYALPSKAMMEAMFKMAANYDKSWGPFEQMHVYEDYWTSTVEQNTPTSTQYYRGVDQSYQSTEKRKELKRVRSVYTVHQW